MEIGEDNNVVSKWPNRWPAESDAPGFKAFMNDFFVQCHNLHLEVSTLPLCSHSLACIGRAGTVLAFRC